MNDIKFVLRSTKKIPGQEPRARSAKKDEEE